MSDLSGTEANVAGILGTPPPVLSGARGAELVRDVWGLAADTVRSLASERDLNLMVGGRYVLKVANPAEDPEVLDMENAAMAHIGEVAPDVPVPALIPAASSSVVAVCVMRLRE